MGINLESNLKGIILLTQTPLFDAMDAFNKETKRHIDLVDTKDRIALRL